MTPLAAGGGQYGNLVQDRAADGYHGTETDSENRAPAAERLARWLAAEVAAEGLSSEKALEVVSSLADGRGGPAVEEVAADAVTLLFAVCLDYEDYRHDVENAIGEIRAIAFGEGYAPPPKRRAAWIETRPYAEMRAAAEKALSNTTETAGRRGA